MIAVDLSPLSLDATNEALEVLAKAQSEDGDIWAPHESVFIRRMIELFTERGLLRLDHVRKSIGEWVERHPPFPESMPTKPSSDWRRWSVDDLALVKVYLEAIPPAAYTVDDWAMLVDYMVSRYLPASDLMSDAEWLVVRSALMGKVQAAVGDVTPEQADAVMGAMPLTVSQAAVTLKLADVARTTMDYARVRACEDVVGLSERVRHGLKYLVMDNRYRAMTGDKTATVSDLQSKLLDQFSVYNRDWRRIAVTEAGEMTNQGLIASLPFGTRVRRMEQYRGACSFCRKIDGEVFTVVDPNDPNKNGDTDVWVGKTNMGRSAAPRKRGIVGLQERSKEEMWWVAAGVMHPNCRGRWFVLEDAKPNDDPEFAKWLDSLLRK